MIKGVRNMVALASGSPDAGSSITKCTGPGVVMAGAEDRDVASWGGGGTPGFLWLRGIRCLLAGGVPEKMEGTASGRR